MKIFIMSKKIFKPSLIGLVLAGLFTLACGGRQLSSAQSNPAQPDEQSNNSSPATKQEKQEKQTAREIWSGTSVGFRIRWTKENLTASLESETTEVFSARDLAQKGFEQYLKAMNNRPDIKVESSDYTRSFKLLSVVGSLISFEDSLDATSRLLRQPSGEFLSQTTEVESRFTTIDITKSCEINYLTDNESEALDADATKPGKAVKLTDFFSEKEVLQALLGDTLVKQALQNGDVPKQPATLNELLNLLEERELTTRKCVFFLPEDYLTRFAFHHVEGNKAAVRLSLKPSIVACRGQKAELGFLLPIPEILKQSLSLAASGKEGFLMQQQSKIGAKQATEINYSSGAKR